MYSMRGVRGVNVLSIIAMGGMLSGGRVLVAQAPTAQALGASVVAPGFQAPSQAVDWRRYETPEMCSHVVMRVVDSANFEIVKDTLSYEARMFAPVPAIVRTLTQSCVERFVHGLLADESVPAMLRLAITVGDTGMVRAMLARSLAGASVARRAAVLDSVTGDLLVDHVTPAKAQLARALVAQVDGFGAAAVPQQLEVHDLLRGFEATSHMDASRDQLIGEFDVDKVLASEQAGLQELLRTPTSALDDDQRRQRLSILKGDSTEIARVQFLKTGSDLDWATYVAGYRSVMVHPDSLIGAPAPQLVGTYWFNVPAHKKSPVVPVPGKINLIVFSDKDPRHTLQRFHTRYPEVQITTVVRTTGTFGLLFLLGHDAQEAELRHLALTDSLHLPGIVVVDSGIYKTHKTGQILYYPSVDEQHYRQGAGNSNEYLIDDTGMIIDNQVTDMDEAQQRVLLQTLQRRMRNHTPRDPH